MRSSVSLALIAGALFMCASAVPGDAAVLSGIAHNPAATPSEFVTHVGWWWGRHRHRHRHCWWRYHRRHCRYWR
jgi:hypothetical protein